MCVSPADDTNTQPYTVPGTPRPPPARNCPGAPPPTAAKEPPGAGVCGWGWPFNRPSTQFFGFCTGLGRKKWLVTALPQSQQQRVAGATSRQVLAHSRLRHADPRQSSTVTITQPRWLGGRRSGRLRWPASTTRAISMAWRCWLISTTPIGRSHPRRRSPRRSWPARFGSSASASASVPSTDVVCSGKSTAEMRQWQRRSPESGLRRRRTHV